MKIKRLSGFKKKEKKLTSEDFHKFNKLFLDKNHIFITKDIKINTYIYLENVKELSPPKKTNN